MKVKIETPNTVMFDVRFEQGDEYRNRCAYHTITFDLDRWVMNARTDNGNYSYGWSIETGGRTFLELMQKIDKDYLLRKVSDCSEFNIEESKERICTDIKLCYEHELEPQELQRVINEINEIDNSCDLNTFVSKAMYIELECDEYGKLGSELVCNNIVTEYPQGALVFAEIFINVIQPLIKEYIENKKSENGGSL